MCIGRSSGCRVRWGLPLLELLEKVLRVVGRQRLLGPFDAGCSSGSSVTRAEQVWRMCLMTEPPCRKGCDEGRAIAGDQGRKYREGETKKKKENKVRERRKEESEEEKSV